jgi:endonuclease YncB( thermonuclease family)
VSKSCQWRFVGPGGLFVCILMLIGTISSALAQVDPGGRFGTRSGKASAQTGDMLSFGRDNLVKLYGIDAPEPTQFCLTRRGIEYPCGNFATNRLSGILGGHEVFCIISHTTLSGVEVGRCQTRNIDLSAAMVATGWAFAERRISSFFHNIQADAQSRRAGLWAGRVEPPWLYRSRLQDDPNADPAPPTSVPLPD